MLSDDLKKIFLGPTLFRIDTVLASRLVPLLYAAGLAALLVWAVAHLFATFGRNFGDGLWGLLEIAVYGLFGLLALRAACEVLLVFFKSNETAVRTVGLSRYSTSLLDEVKDAIGEIADQEEDIVVEEPPAPAPAPAPAAASTPRPVRRTAKRTPPGPVSE